MDGGATHGGSRLVSPDALMETLRAGPRPVLLDLMPAEVYARRRLPGAVSACVYETAFTEHVRALGLAHDADIVLCGADGRGHDAAAAADKLARMGYLRVRILHGGVRGWRDAGLPLEGDAPGAPDPDTGRPVTLPSRAFRVDAADSCIRWTGRNRNGSHEGTVAVAGGVITMRDEAAEGYVEADLTRMTCTDIADAALAQVLLAHLASSDFFDTARTPRARFDLTAIRALKPPRVEAPGHILEGRVSVRGVTRPLAVEATIDALPDDRYAVETHFDIDRTTFGALYGSEAYFAHLGMHAVHDRVSIEVRLVLV